MVLFLYLVQMPSAPLMLKFGHLISVVCDVACMGGEVGSKPQTFFFCVCHFLLVGLGLMSVGFREALSNIVN